MHSSCDTVVVNMITIVNMVTMSSLVLCTKIEYYTSPISELAFKNAQQNKLQREIPLH